MQLPTIHLNGTSRESLVEDLCAVSAALETAYQALKQCVPNGRDYYPQGPMAMQKATDEHCERLRKLDALKAEIENFAGQIMDL